MVRILSRCHRHTAALALLCAAAWVAQAGAGLGEGVQEKPWRTVLTEFKSWFAASGGVLHRNVRVDLSTTASGARRTVRLVSKGRIGKGQSIVTVPDSLLIRAPPAPAHSPFTAHQRLALHLLRLRQSADSGWEPYFAILPPPPLSTAL